MSRVSAEVVDLTGRFCDGDLSPEQAARLESLAAGSADARQFVRDSFLVHCELSCEFGRKVDFPAEATTANERLPITASYRAPRPKRWTVVMLAVASLLLVSVGATIAIRVRHGRMLRESEPMSPPGHVAHVGRLQGVRWNGGTAAAPADLLPPGRKLAIQEGLLQVCFDSGAAIIIQGPAEVELQSSNSVALHNGCITADVPVEGRGFAVRTPNATLIDLGTRFGVAWEAGRTDVEVFDGNVLVRPREAGGDGPPEQRLAAHQALRVSDNADGHRLRMAPIAEGSRKYVRSFQDCVESIAPACACPTVPQAAADLIGPWHCPRGPLVAVDLSRQANWSWTDSTRDRAGNSLIEFPPGRRVLAGVEFQIPPRHIQLRGKGLPDLPRMAAGIPVGRQVVRLYILHGAQFCRAGIADGELIAEYRVRYSDGSQATIPVALGQDVRDWWASRPEPVSRGQVAWVGYNPATRRNKYYLRLYLCTWENPHPEKSVASIDYAAINPAAGPFCVAMMAEEPLLSNTIHARDRANRHLDAGH